MFCVFKHLSSCGVENGLQEAERQAREEAMAPVQVQDDDGGSGGDEK